MNFATSKIVFHEKVIKLFEKGFQILYSFTEVRRKLKENLKDNCPLKQSVLFSQAKSERSERDVIIFNGPTSTNPIMPFVIFMSLTFCVDRLFFAE